MGMWPFGQFWLPAAHPAALSPVSALLSGVMIKTGVYGLIRCFLWLIPADQKHLFPTSAWGLVISILGTISLFVGTMQALKQDHSKRLLAFSSMGQIGYVLLAVGASMALMPTAGSAPATLAALALMGALFHVINHALFKGLLFLNAGSMLHATDTQDLNKMGGLLRFMPITGVTVLVASFAIAGVPLFNGFVSKWLIYSAAIQGSAAAKYLPLCAAVAILTSALTLACFIKFFGVSFLSRKSALIAAQVESKGHLEVGWLMQAPQIALALACILLGLVPALGFGLVQRALATSPGGFGPALATATPGAADAAGLSTATGAVYAPLFVGVIVCALFWLASRLTQSAGAQRRTAAPWLCGYALEADCHRYVSSNFYGEIKRYFRWVGGVQTAPTRPGLKGPELKG
jgi:formate hydrogenlyase subunit 3/multisubunit Na+/H+ antiporter MnhD subunit